jgi:hypothetical protein
MGVIQAIASVMTDVSHVAKRDVNQHQRYQFRGVDAVVNAVGPALRRHHVVVAPTFVEATYEHVQTSQGKPATACRVNVTYTFAHGDERFDVATVGEAWDSGDKACPKAMSVAYRTALLQALCLPTDEPDPDSFSYERHDDDPRTLAELMAEAAELGVPHDYPKLEKWARESDATMAKAMNKLRREISEAAGTGEGPSVSENVPLPDSPVPVAAAGRGGADPMQAAPPAPATPTTPNR